MSSFVVEILKYNFLIYKCGSHFHNAASILKISLKGKLFLALPDGDNSNVPDGDSYQQYQVGDNKPTPVLFFIKKKNSFYKKEWIGFSEGKSKQFLETGLEFHFV